MSTPIKVAVYLYPKADPLDFTGPIEIFSTPSPAWGPSPFEITTFAHHNPVASGAQALTYIPKATFAHIAATIATFDILVIPGAEPATITDLLATQHGAELAALLRAFVATPPRSETGQRVLQSVCSGSILVAASGVLANRRVTTHHWCWDQLQSVADSAAASAATDAAAAAASSNITLVKNARWVDGGLTDAGVRIVSAAGVTSGIDVSLWVVGLFAGEAQKALAAECAEFEPRDAAWGVVG